MQEIFDGYVCTFEGVCKQPLQDGQPPCCDCDYCVSVEALEELADNRP